MKNLETYLQEAVDNIRNDRQTTEKLLKDLSQYMASDNSKHREVGVVAAKYVETLQRSNEQLVKIAALLQKKQGKDAGLSEEDKNELFDVIKGGV